MDEVGEIEDTEVDRQALAWLASRFLEAPAPQGDDLAALQAFWRILANGFARLPWPELDGHIHQALSEANGPDGDPAARALSLLEVVALNKAEGDELAAGHR